MTSLCLQNDENEYEYENDSNDEYSYYDSDEENEVEESEKQLIIDDTIETDIEPYNFVNDLLFTLYNDFILPWSLDESNGIDVVINMSGLLNFIELYSKSFDLEELMITYHGTTNESIEKIKETMFIVPDGNNVKIRNGSLYGLGVYSSPLINVASGYTTNNKIIVCLLAPGNINYQGPWKNKHNEGFNTNYCKSTEIICTFDSKRVCPLFIIDKKNINKITSYCDIIKGFIKNVFQLTSERHF
jgi:hypothetical protein